MEEKKASSKICRRCGHCDGYYTKNANRFIRAAQSYCKKYDKIVENGDTCECYIANHIGRARSQAAVSQRLAEILRELCEVRQILQENAEEAKQG